MIRPPAPRASTGGSFGEMAVLLMAAGAAALGALAVLGQSGAESSKPPAAPPGKYERTKKERRDDRA